MAAVSHLSAPPVRQSNRTRTLSTRGRTAVVRSGEHGELETNAGGKVTKGRHNKTSEIDTTAKVLEMILEQIQSTGGLQQEVGSIWQSRAPRRDSPGVDGHDWNIV